MAIVLPKFPRRRPSSGGPAEAQPAVNVALCREDGVYRAGGRLRATWRISRVPLEQIQGVEISVMWHTQGKGDEDLHVHHFHRINESQIRRTGLADQQSIQCQLPITPLSYHGRLIQLQWCIRLRLFMASAKEIVTEQPFYLVSGTAYDDNNPSDQVTGPITYVPVNADDHTNGGVNKIDDAASRLIHATR